MTPPNPPKSNHAINQKESIVAISTPMGAGAISVVRLSGKDSLAIARKLTHREDFTPRIATLCDIYGIESEVLDEAIVICFPSPHSYTGEDICEIQCHGGVVLAKLVLNLCLSYGARLAEVGEFTKRALLNGKMDLSQVEATARLISAQNATASKMLARQLKGALSDFVGESKEKLLSMLASSEVMIDYSEEDIPSDLSATLERDIKELRARLCEILEFSKMRDVILEGYELSIIGKPNVGKSSLLNALLLQDKAIVSAQAGTTRDTIEGRIQLEDNVLKLIDTAGIRKSDDEIECIGIERSLRAMEESDIILAVFDSSRGLDGEDLEIITHLKALEDKKIIVLNNKSDLDSKLGLEELRARINAEYFLDINTKETAHILKLKEMLLGIITQNHGHKEDILLSAEYQIEAVKKTIASLDGAHARLESLELELFSYHIKDALESISLLIAPYDIDEMFDKMFSEFCLGK